MYTQFPTHAKRQRGELIAIAGAGRRREVAGHGGCVQQYSWIWELQNSLNSAAEHKDSSSACKPPFYFIFAPETLTGFKRKNLYTVFDLKISVNGLKLPRTHDQQPGTSQSASCDGNTCNMRYGITDYSPSMRGRRQLYVEDMQEYCFLYLHLKGWDRIID